MVNAPLAAAAQDDHVFHRVRSVPPGGARASSKIFW
jgi:hypothetical protein